MVLTGAAVTASPAISVIETSTHASSSAFSGYRWPPEVIVTAVRWYLSYPLSARQVSELLG